MKFFKNKIFKISLLLLGIVMIFTFGLNTTAAANNTTYNNLTTSQSYLNSTENNLTDINNSKTLPDPQIWRNGVNVGDYNTITDAVNAAQSGDTIILNPGTYYENNININTDMTIKGGTQDNTIIDAQGLNNIFNIATGVKVIIQNVTLQNGDGGAIYNGGSLTVNDCTFSSNSVDSGYGGAIDNNGNLVVNGCTFTDNEANGIGSSIDYPQGQGGAIANWGNSIVNNSTFSNNFANLDGGAIYNYGTMTITITNFYGNRAIGIQSIYGPNPIGGAIYNNAGSITITGSTFIGNSATDGGNEIYNTAGTIIVHSSNIAGNDPSCIVNDPDGDGTVDASLNWWGSNDDPSGNVYGNVNVTPWIIITAPPTVIANIKNGLYNTNKVVTLSMNGYGTIYYTLNGSTPTLTSAQYTGPITISSTKTLKYFGVDIASNQSPIYTQTYTIDKIPPKVSKTTPTNKKTNVSRTSTISIKFNENIKFSTYYKNIKVKNLTTGKYVTIHESISGTTLNIKTSKTRTRYNWYEIIIPRAAIKDLAGNNLLANYTFKFKTGK